MGATMGPPWGPQLCYDLGSVLSLPILLLSLLHLPSTPSPNSWPLAPGQLQNHPLTPLYLVLTDDPGWRQWCGEDISAGPV